MTRQPRYQWLCIKNLHTEMAVFDKYLILTNLEFFFLFSFGFVFLREGTCVLLGWVGAE